MLLVFILRRLKIRARMAGGGDFRPASGDGGVGGVDYRNEKHFVRGLFSFDNIDLSEI